MTPEERRARLQAVKRYRLTDEGTLALLDALMEPSVTERALRPCKQGHGVEHRYPSGGCRECGRLREKGRG
jgi:hypothetical protein